MTEHEKEVELHRRYLEAKEKGAGYVDVSDLWPNDYLMPPIYSVRLLDRMDWDKLLSSTLNEN